jgi:nucleoside-diphosphate-sugar epimerase
MRVLVTGHLGFIRTVMAPMLLKSGREVVSAHSTLYERCASTACGDIQQTLLRRRIRQDRAPSRRGTCAVAQSSATKSTGS